MRRLSEEGVACPARRRAFPMIGARTRTRQPRAPAPPAEPATGMGRDTLAPCLPRSFPSDCSPLLFYYCSSRPPCWLPPNGSQAPPLPVLELERVFPALTFERPVLLTHAGDGSGLVYVRGAARRYPPAGPRRAGANGSIPRYQRAREPERERGGPAGGWRSIRRSLRTDASTSTTARRPLAGLCCRGSKPTTTVWATPIPSPCCWRRHSRSPITTAA